jgi:hypothetical protein
LERTGLDVFDWKRLTTLGCARFGFCVDIRLGLPAVGPLELDVLGGVFGSSLQLLETGVLVCHDETVLAPLELDFLYWATEELLRAFDFGDEILLALAALELDFLYETFHTTVCA